MSVKDTPHIRPAAVKRLAKDYGRRVSAEFLQQLDAHVRRMVRNACQVHNGGKVTLDASVAGFVGIR